MSTRVGSHTRACGGAVVSRAHVRPPWQDAQMSSARGRRRRRASVASFMGVAGLTTDRAWRGGVRRAAREAVDHDDSDVGGELGGLTGEQRVVCGWKPIVRTLLQLVTIWSHNSLL